MSTSISESPSESAQRLAPAPHRLSSVVVALQPSPPQAYSDSATASALPAPLLLRWAPALPAYLIGSLGAFWMLQRALPYRLSLL